MSDDTPSSTLQDRTILWKHCVNSILALDSDDLKELKKGGIKRMNHFFQYATNIENFDRRFPDNSPTIVNVRYFIMHCHVNNYKTCDVELMMQDEETFGGIDVIDLESKYWSLIKLERASAESVPLPPDTNLKSQTTETSTGLPKTNFMATTAAAKSVFDTGGIAIPSIPLSTTLPSAKLFSKTIQSLTHDPSLITPDLVDISGFIKHTRIKLTAEDDILTFYKNV